MIAAEKTGRKAQAGELDPKYVDVAIQRWEKYTGKTATLAPLDDVFEDVREARAADALA